MNKEELRVLNEVMEELDQSLSLAEEEFYLNGNPSKLERSLIKKKRLFGKI